MYPCRTWTKPTMGLAIGLIKKDLEDGNSVTSRFSDIIVSFLDNITKSIENAPVYCPDMLHIAAKEGHLEIVKHLLTPVHDTCPIADSRMLISYTCKYGHRIKVAAILELRNYLDIYSSEIITKGRMSSLTEPTDFKHKIDTKLELLFEAARQSWTKSCRRRINDGVDVNARDACGRTPLHYAYSGEIAQLLIDHKADIEVQDQDGTTPLILAAHPHARHWGRLHELVSSSQQVIYLMDNECHFKRESQALHEDSLRSEQVMKVLLDNGADIHARDKRSFTALHNAAGGGRVENISILLKHGADVNALSECGQTPLSCTHLRETAEILLTNGVETKYIEPAIAKAVTNVIFVDYITSFLRLDFAVRRRPSFRFKPAYVMRKPIWTNPSVIDQRRQREKNIPFEYGLPLLKELIDCHLEYLMKREGRTLSVDDIREVVRRDPFLSKQKSEFPVDESLVLKYMTDVTAFAYNYDTPILFTDSHLTVERLLEEGANVDARSIIHKGTALHNAVYHDRADIVATLLRYGADINAINLSDLLPIHLVRSSDTAELLLKNGASLNVKTNLHGITPLHLVLERMLDSCDPRLDGRARPNFWNPVKLTPEGHSIVAILSPSEYAKIDYSSEILAQSRKLIEYLLQNGADVNASTKKGQTVIHQVAAMGCIETASILVKFGVCINHDGGTKINAPLFYARSAAMVEFLLENGADVHAKTIVGQYTALHGAVLADCPRSVTILLRHGAVINSVSQNGKLPIHYVESKETAEILLKNGALINAKANLNRTPLHEVLQRMFESCCWATEYEIYDPGELPDRIRRLGDLWFLERNLCDVALATSSSPGLRQIYDDSKDLIQMRELIEYLLQNGADVNAADENGKTVLHQAAQIGCIETASILVQFGADPVHYIKGLNDRPLLRSRSGKIPEFINQQTLKDSLGISKL